MHELTLTLPGHMDYLYVAVSFVKKSARAFGFSEKDLEKIHLAAEESICNIIIHALNNNPDEFFTIICRKLPTSIEIVIRDKGIPFSPETLPEYNLKKLAETEDIGGLGLYLLKEAVDEVIFHNLGRDGHETILVKYLKSKHIDNLIEDEVNLSEEITIKPLKKWNIRKFIPSDALEISRCAYRTYGYTYEPYIYYPDSIVDMNARGELQSTVAVNEKDELLAHIALKFYHPDDPIAEIGVAFVKPEYRKYRIFSKLCDYEYKRAKEIGLNGIYGRAVTSHVFSQKKLVESGFVSCGVLLGLFPLDIDFKKLGGKILQKESALLEYLPLNNTCETVIYPPEHHKEIVEKIFNFINLPFKYVLDKAINIDELSELEPLLEQPRMSYCRTEVFNTADIICFTGDLEIVADINMAKKKLCMEHTDVLYLYLDLESPNIPKLVEECEKLGFFFSGILPFGLRGHHAMVLQYLNNLEIDFEKIKMYGTLAQELLSHVKKCKRGI